MTLHETIRYLRNYLDSADAIYTLAKKKDLFAKTINIVERDAKICETKETNIQTWDSKDSELVIECLNYLLAVLNEQVIGEETSKFMDSYSTMAYNYNRNTHHSERIDLLSQTVNRYTNLRWTTVELLQNLKMVSKNIKELSHVSFQPIQLSKHYLASFDTKNNK